MSGPPSVELDTSQIRRSSWQQYAVRFLFGGVVTAAVGIIGAVFGPVIAGLFLAFPAILPASTTLIERHEGEEAAGTDAWGAAIGSIGLAAFAAVVWWLATRTSAILTLAAATGAWLVVSVALWIVVERLHRG